MIALFRVKDRDAAGGLRDADPSTIGGVKDYQYVARRLTRLRGPHLEQSLVYAEARDF